MKTGWKRTDVGGFSSRKVEGRTLPSWFVLIVPFLTILAVSPAYAKTYSTNFPFAENPISQGGRWKNGQTNGIDWSNVRTTPGLAFGTQTGTNGFDDSVALLTGTWGPDQTVEATVHSVNQSLNF